MLFYIKLDSPHESCIRGNDLSWSHNVDRQVLHRCLGLDLCKLLVNVHILAVAVLGALCSGSGYWCVECDTHDVYVCDAALVEYNLLLFFPLTLVSVVVALVQSSGGLAGMERFKSRKALMQASCLFKYSKITTDNFRSHDCVLYWGSYSFDPPKRTAGGALCLLGCSKDK